MAGKETGTAFTVTLPKQAIDVIDNLATMGIFGDKRAVVARTLILDAIKRLVADGIISADDLKPKK